MKDVSIFDANKYKGEWVAFVPDTDEVVGHGATLRAAEVAALKEGIDNPELYQVPKTDGYFVGGGAA